MSIDNQLHIGSSQTQLKILRISEVIAMLGLSRSTIYDRMNPRSPRYDETFPKPIKLGSNHRNIAVGWIEVELVKWIQQMTQ